MNTIITLSTIFLLTKVFKSNYILANIIGYILGLTNSFLMNKLWTFKSFGKYYNELIRFILVFAVCYLLQLTLLVLLKENFDIDTDYSQIISMVFYTIINFFSNKLITFKKVDNT